MNKPIRNLAIACLVLFLALLLNINYVQAVDADNLNAKAGNRRVIDEQFSRHRGAILVGDDPIADSDKSNDRYVYQRTYPNGPLYAPVTGFFSYLFGQSALEKSQNPALSGSDSRLFVNRVVDLLANQQPEGASVEVTLNRRAQETAASGLEALGPDAQGAVVALNPQTGAILATVTQPSYDPNLLASHDLAAVQKAWKSLTSDPAQPMLNRGTQQVLPPGSTFKLVTAAAAIEDLGLTPDSRVKGGARLTFEGRGFTLPNEGGSNCGGDPITLERALNVSCNVTFGDLAVKIGGDKLIEMAEKFGFGESPIESIPSSASRVALEDGELDDPTYLAKTGIGQQDVAATPLQMAMVTAAIANGGDLMKPYLVKTVRSPSLRVLEQAVPERLSQPISSQTAGYLRQMMVSTVTQGTATTVQIPGVTIGAKTGTAQSAADRPPYAWFVAFAPETDPQVAVAVVVESSNTNRSEIAGSRLAAPIARSVIEAVLDQ